MRISDKRQIVVISLNLNSLPLRHLAESAIGRARASSAILQHTPSAFEKLF